MKPIKVLPMREHVASELRKGIFAGDFSPGEELVQDRLAVMLGVSRTPIREAIQILRIEGLVSVIPNKGAIVENVTSNLMRDHYEFRMLLEGEAAARASQRMPDVAALESIYDEEDEALKKEDVHRSNLCNEAFHQEIWAAAGSRILKNQLLQTWNGFPGGMSKYNKEGLVLSHAEHLTIIQAIAKKKPKKAKELMKQHVERSLNNLLKRITVGESIFNS